SSTAADLKIAVEPSDMTVNGIAGRQKVGLIYGQQLRLPGLIIDSLNFHIADYGMLARFYGEKIDGIIGYSVLKNYIVELDNDNSIISFYTTGTISYPKNGFLLKPLIISQPYQSASLNDTRPINSHFILDIGANITLMLSSDFEKDSMPIRACRKRFIKQAEGVGGKFDIQMTVIREFKIGPYKFRDVPVCIFEDSNNIISYPYNAGIIGNDLLKRFNIILNYSSKEIFLKPNSHFNDPFDYSYTGIELYYIKGFVLIGEVAAGSPAEKAGLKEGDILIAVNDFSNLSLSDFKDALVKSTGLIKLAINRGGRAMEFRFKLKSIL
ncbi:MAG TPA: aspartyl protease family protein, partial [Puia sp.]|nr:aspartyl protease family protein [Puia sp.]